MRNMRTVEIKAFVPARDFALSKRFYENLGFTLAWSDDDLACFHHGHS
jgi:predicted lactoylglutathione lyase